MRRTPQKMSHEIQALLGGALIGLGSLIAMATSGKVPGISGVVAKVIRRKKDDWGWRVIFLAGIVLGGTLTFLLVPVTQEYALPGGRGILAVAIAGLVVGFGARMGGGCTSGHGVCGIGSLARDALVYTVVFMTAGAATVFLWNLIGS